MPYKWNEIISGCVQDIPTKSGEVAKGVATLSCIPAVFSLILHFIFSLAGIAALFFVLLAGFKFVTSGGDAKQVEEARKTLTYAIIGLIVILLSFAIINLISQITGATCILNFGFDICK